MWHNVIQNSDEPCDCCGKMWMDLRTGKVTSSSISKIMANFGKAFGDPAKKVATQIAVFELGGRPSENNYTNSHMERGHQQEPIAKKLYEDTYFCDILNGGFYDNGRTGASPDGHIYEDGLAEIKSVEETQHYSCIKRNSFDPAYKWQLSFELKESKRKWVDYISYCSYFPTDKQLVVFKVMSTDLVEQFQMIDFRLEQFFKMVDEIKSDISRLK